MPTPAAPHMDEALAATLAKWGADKTKLDAAIEKESSNVSDERPPFYVWLDCWESVVFFLDCEPLWRFVSTMEKVQRIGIDRQQVESEMRLRGWGLNRANRKVQALWQDLLVMERAALAVFNEKGN